MPTLTGRYVKGRKQQHYEIIFPDYDVRYIAINDNVDTLKSENKLMAFKNIFNDWYARDTSKKIRAVMKAKGNSGKHLTTNVIYGYKKAEHDKNVWVIDEEAAAVVRKIFRLCIEGNGPSQIARILTDKGIPTPTAYYRAKGLNDSHPNAKAHRWDSHTIADILEKPEYLGHTVNFRTHVKSYKHKKTIHNPKEDWLIFENTHEPIISEHDFNLVQELRKNKRRLQKCDKPNPFSGIVYCADCGSKMYLCRAKSLSDEQEHLKCSTYADDKNACTAHFIRTVVLKNIVLSEINKLLTSVKENEQKFIQSAMDNSKSAQQNEIKKRKKAVTQAEKRIAELDRLFTRLYEDNVLGKISDERFSAMSKSYEDEQTQLKEQLKADAAFITQAEERNSDMTMFLEIVKKYERITELTPEIMHELVEKIIVHAPDKSSGHCTQQIDIHFRFNIATATAVAKRTDYDKRKKTA